MSRFRLTAPDGTIMAVSKPFDTKTDAVAGIAAVREYAGMGLISDHCTATVGTTPPRAYDAAQPAGSAGPKDRLPRLRQGRPQSRVRSPLGRCNTQPLLSAGEGPFRPLLSPSFT